MSGYFIVFPYPEGTEHPHDIAFKLRPDIQGNVPEHQSKLKAEIEKTLGIMNSVLNPSSRTFKEYYDNLLEVARFGLVGDAPQPTDALQTVKHLQEEFYDQKGGSVKNRHMRRIILVQLLLMLILLIPLLYPYLVGIAFRTQAASPEVQLWLLDLELYVQQVGLYSLMAIGALVGLIFASFLRCNATRFPDLHRLERDQFSPFVKAIFALVTLVIVGLFIKTGAIKLSVGDFDLREFDRSVGSALTFGVLIGFGQEAIVSRLERLRSTL